MARPTTAAQPAMQIAIAVFMLFFGLQAAFWSHTHGVRPAMEIVPEVPGKRTMRALSFGDEEAFFRLYALGLQNSGDTFGRFTALYKYDFKRLHQWLTQLTEFNNQSNYLPAQASYYFSQTQNPADARYLVDYLQEYTKGRAEEKWWWVIQGIYIAQHKMGDLDRAQQLADSLKGVQNIPIWAQQMPAFIHEQRGEFGDALGIIEGILKNHDQYSQGELNFMRYFVEERLGKLDAVKKEFDEIQDLKDTQRAQGIKEPTTMGPPPDVGALELPARAPAQ